MGCCSLPCEAFQRRRQAAHLRARGDGDAHHARAVELPAAVAEQDPFPGQSPQHLRPARRTGKLYRAISPPRARRFPRQRTPQKKLDESGKTVEARLPSLARTLAGRMHSWVFDQRRGEEPGDEVLPKFMVMSKWMATPTLPLGWGSTRTTSATYSQFIGSVGPL
jgi:hypothetical protein